VFSLFIGPPTSESAFQTGGALAGIISLLSALHGIETFLILVHFIQIVRPLLLYEYKGQSVVTQFLFLLPVEVSTIPGHFRWYYIK